MHAEWSCLIAKGSTQPSRLSSSFFIPVCLSGLFCSRDLYLSESAYLPDVGSSHSPGEIQDTSSETLFIYYYFLHRLLSDRARDLIPVPMIWRIMSTDRSRPRGHPFHSPTHPEARRSMEKKCPVWLTSGHLCLLSSHRNKLSLWRVRLLVK